MSVAVARGLLGWVVKVRVGAGWGGVGVSGRAGGSGGGVCLIFFVRLVAWLCLNFFGLCVGYV